MQKFPISLVIITLNEEKNIERCIRSVPFATEVVVLDSGSQDKTIDIARRLGARVFVEPWRGYAKQKTRATAIATQDWILSLDADEALSPEAQEEIVALLAQPLTYDAYTLPRLCYYLERWMYHGGMYPDYQTRLYNRTNASWLDTPVHEHLVAEKTLKLKKPIFHWSFNSVAQHIETINRYSSLRAEDFKTKGKSFCAGKMMIKTASKFFEIYFIKRGFRDGIPGLIAAVVSSFSTFLRWAKLYEYDAMNQDKRPRT
ncbi:MAG: hypothetical protein A2Z20_04710 [Bdellovibrionales bacterium RBG_16_40_8]|nr:MAG: hypothetical protein A2Z20_04710 [Bdellovibrionales bacterium RBG_16_40_8]